MTRMIPLALPLLTLPLLTLPLLTLPLLAACGSPIPADDAAPANATAANTTDAATIRALPPGQRDGVFLRAIRDSGADCQQVTQTSEQAVANGPATWAVECDRSGRYVVAIDAGGIAIVTPAEALPKG
jgi:hypothetical protein